MTPFVIDFLHSSILISSSVAKKALTPGTDEYRRLMEVRKEFPDFRLVTREFKKNTKQEHYRGLTYDFMRDYISSHEENPTPVLFELNEQIGVSKCHSLSKRYPTIKAWFLGRYPEIAEFGMPSSEAA